MLIAEEGWCIQPQSSQIMKEASKAVRPSLSIGPIHIYVCLYMYVFFYAFGMPQILLKIR